MIVTTHDGAVYAFNVPKRRSHPMSHDYSQSAAASTSAQVPAAAPAAVGPAFDQAQCTQASLAFINRCAMCHDSNGQRLAPRTPNFTDPAWQRSKSDAELMEAIKKGRPGGMLAFAGALKHEDVTQLVQCAVRAFGTPAVR